MEFTFFTDHFSTTAVNVLCFMSIILSLFIIRDSRKQKLANVISKSWDDIKNVFIGFGEALDIRTKVIKDIHLQTRRTNKIIDECKNNLDALGEAEKKHDIPIYLKHAFMNYYIQSQLLLTNVKALVKLYERLHEIEIEIHKASSDQKVSHLIDKLNKK